MAISSPDCAVLGGRRSPEDPWPVCRLFQGEPEGPPLPGFSPPGRRRDQIGEVGLPLLGKAPQRGPDQLEHLHDQARLGSERAERLTVSS
jgi:hypothetical protein